MLWINIKREIWLTQRWRMTYWITIKNFCNNELSAQILYQAHCAWAWFGFQVQGVKSPFFPSPSTYTFSAIVVAAGLRDDTDVWFSAVQTLYTTDKHYWCQRDIASNVDIGCQYTRCPSRPKPRGKRYAVSTPQTARQKVSQLKTHGDCHSKRSLAQLPSLVLMATAICRIVCNISAFQLTSMTDRPTWNWGFLRGQGQYQPEER